MSDEENLISQSEARREAKRLNDSGEVPEDLIAVALPVPFSSWGGREKGWTVAYFHKELT